MIQPQHTAINTFQSFTSWFPNMPCYSQKLMIIKYCCFQTVINLDKVWRHLLSPLSQKGAVGISKSVFWTQQHSTAVLQWTRQPVPFRSSWSHTWQNSDTEQKTQIQNSPFRGTSGCGNNSRTLATYHSVTDLFPAAVQREVKYLFWLALCQHGLEGRSLESRTCPVSHSRPAKASGDSNEEKEQQHQSSAWSLPACQHTPRGKGSGMLLSQPQLWPSCQLRAKFAGASCAQGGLLKAREPPSPAGGAGWSLCALIPDGLCRQYRTPRENSGSQSWLWKKCLWRQTRRARAPAHRTEPPHGARQGSHTQPRVVAF